MNTTTLQRKTLSIAVSGLLFSAIGTLVYAADAVVTQSGGITTITAPEQASDGADVIDYENAQPMPLPTIDEPPPVLPDAAGAPAYPGEPGVSGDARRGNGKENLKILTPRKSLKGTGVEPQEYGTSNHPFTTSRVDLTTPLNKVSRYYPFRAAGKLFFKIGTSSFICSASLVKKGIVVTAAHCVNDYGKKKFYTGFQYVPAYYNGEAPYGVWTHSRVRVLPAYFNGTDVCSTPGVVCKNDVAVITLAAKRGTYPGTSTGTFNYGWNGYGFTPQNIALVSQLGYPASHDSGRLMQRSDSQGFVSNANAGNTIWGSRQTGGSSGGPELVNLGVLAVLNGTSVGAEARSFNTVVGVTSWGYTDNAIKQQGASPFLSTNVKALVDAACAATPAAC